MAKIPGSLYASFDLERFRGDFRSVLKQRKFTYDQVAEEVGLCRRTISHTLSYASSPGIDVMASLIAWAGLKFEEYVIIHREV